MVSTVLSVLDLAPVGDGSSPAQALANSVQLAQLAERLGFTRLWVAEHHNMPGIASSSPPVLIAHLAAHTTTLRLGAGGVMLPNHSQLVVAEQFGMLEALHPGRIDLAIGRAPGTDMVTAAALRRAPVTAADDFPEQLQELFAYFEGTHPQITAVPGRGYCPSLWILGSSTYGAQAAGYLGLPYSFAYHFSSGGVDAAIDTYRRCFRPSAALDAPYVSIGVPVICAEDGARARWLAGPSSVSFVRLRTGRPTPLPTPEAAAEYRFTPMEQELLRSWNGPLICGDPDEVTAGLRALADRTGVDEFVVTTMVHGAPDRLHSYELIADAWGTVPRAAA